MWIICSAYPWGPQRLAFDVDRAFVFEQLVFAAREAFEDRADVDCRDLYSSKCLGSLCRTAERRAVSSTG